MKRLRTVAVVAVLLTAAPASSRAAPPDSSAAAPVAGSITLGASALWLNSQTIVAEVTWECSPSGPAVIVVDVVQQPVLEPVPTRGTGVRIVVCDGTRHVTNVNVHALIGGFQLGDAVATATLRPLRETLPAFSDQRTIRIVFR